MFGSNARRCLPSLHSFAVTAQGSQDFLARTGAITSPRAQRLSNGRQTLAFEIDRPLTNGRLWTEIEAGAAGNDAVLITFVEPLDEGIRADSERGRSEVIGELRERWPATANVPLEPDGGLHRR